MPIELFNQTRPQDLFVYVNNITDGHFGWVILMCIFVAAFFSLHNLGNARSFAASSFLTSILAVIFYTLGIINVFVLGLSAFAIISSVVVLKNQGE